MRIYITTAKHAHKISKQLGRVLASFLPHAVFEPRGRKTIYSVWERAMQLGKNTVLLIYERHASPSSFQFLLFSKGDWVYGPCFVFDDFKLPNNLKHFDEPVGTVEGMPFGSEEGESVKTYKRHDWLCFRRGRYSLCFKHWREENAGSS